MKKLMVIAALSFFILTGCEKVDLTPVSEDNITTRTSDLIPLPQVNAFFTITNTETDYGVVEYRVEYIDCNGVVQNVPLLMQQSIKVCLKYGIATTNFANTIKPVK